MSRRRHKPPHPPATITIVCDAPVHDRPVTVARFRWDELEQISDVVGSLEWRAREDGDHWVLLDLSLGRVDLSPDRETTKILNSRPRSDSRGEVAHRDGNTIIVPCTCGIRVRLSVGDKERICDGTHAERRDVVNLPGLAARLTKQ